MRRVSRLLLVSLCAVGLWGQNESGYIAGSVRDSDGKVIPAASVHIAAIRSGEKRETVASRNGTYQAAALRPGSYRITASAEGFTPAVAEVMIHVGAHVRQEFVLQRATGANRVRRRVISGIETTTPTQAELVTGSELNGLPNLTRDPYRMAELAGNVSDAGLGTRGVGLAMNGQRESSTTILLDGADNKDEFSGSIGHPYPLDSTLEFSILTSDFTAQYGRASGGIVNVAGKSGSNEFHATAYEFNRVSALASNSFENNANGIRLPAFDRNQFGAAAGGAIRRDRLFFFTNTEGTLVRSDGVNYAWVVTPQLLDRTAPVTQNFFQALGQLRPGAQVLGTLSLGQLAATAGKSPCIGLICIALPTNIPILSHVAYQAPGDSGGGPPQNTWNSYNRVDWAVDDRMRLYGRYGIYSEHDEAGVLSNSPFANYDLGNRQVDHAAAIGATRAWNARWISQTSLTFDRLGIDQQGLTSRGVVPTMYANPVAPVTIGSDPVAFPGYNPFTPGGAGAFGGPENILQVNHNTSWTKGNHLFDFGGNYTYIRDNRTDAAYQTANDSLANDQGLGAALDGLISGTFQHVQVAVDPQGNLPCLQTPSCTLNLPATSPGFSRSDRYHDAALYAQDSWRVTRRITISAGVRWDYFGVQHNVNPKLDSNWYAPKVGFADSNLIQYMTFGGVLPVAMGPTGGLYQPDWKDFAPRVGLAWDVFGDGRTSVRGGYGIAYDRNFNNVTFNVIQNLPNYTVLDVPGLITTNNFGPLGGSGTIALPPGGARIIDPYLKTAYARIWNATVERAIGQKMTYSLEYSGSKGIHLYSISYPNQDGFGNVYGGDPCTGKGDCRTPPNYAYNEDVGYRGNQGFSNYYALNNRFRIANLWRTGVVVTAVYTWSRAIDNISSTFFEA
ncbi:MAG TPA: TonB-dependent receptor, partial [Bryobacteraceae bacterium]